MRRRRQAAPADRAAGPADRGYSIPIYTAIAVIYITANGWLSFLARWLDRRTRHRYGRTVQPSAADEAA